LLLLGWLLLLVSLFWDPVTPRFTDPSNDASPFRVNGSSVIIQGEAITSEPYAMGNRIFWSMIVPLVPLFLLVAGHEAWRRICPLSFVSQLPGLFGIQRKRRKLNRRSGVVESAVILPERQGFYLFAGRGNLALLPGPVVRGIDILIVLLTSLWLVQTLRRHPLDYRQESLAASLRRQLERIDIDFPRLLDGRTLKDLKPAEIYVLSRTLPEFTQSFRLQTYRSLVQDLIDTHGIDQASSQTVLDEMRAAIGISEAEHREILLELGISEAESSQIQHSAVFENWLRRDNYRVACEALLLGQLRPGMRLSEVIAKQECSDSIKSLVEIYQITPSEHQQALTQIGSRAGLLYERALRDLDQLIADAALAFALNLVPLVA
jgi:hypothetical protein